jgi:hypothetical protein
VFVFSSNQYYVQGTPNPTPPNGWFLPGVNLGSTTDPDDRNAPYAIYAVVADSAANADIQRLYDETNGETGIPDIPGGAGADKVANITVTRTARGSISSLTKRTSARGPDVADPSRQAQ